MYHIQDAVLDNQDLYESILDIKSQIKTQREDRDKESPWGWRGKQWLYKAHCALNYKKRQYAVAVRKIKYYRIREALEMQAAKEDRRRTHKFNEARGKL